MRFREISFVKKHAVGIAVLCLIILNGILGTLLVGAYVKQNAEERYAQSLYELSLIEESFDQIGDFFSTLSEDEGAVYAFEVMKRAVVPPNIDTHLLAHIVGDELYRQQGIEGMKHCTADFRYACSHTVVIGALLEHGLGIIKEFEAVCRRSTGGDVAYPMCFHGVGHGVLAFAEYEIPEALEICELMGPGGRESREYTECVGGVTMEMVSGIHDPALWEEKKEKYLSDENPVALCLDGWYPEEGEHMCLMYVTPELFAAADLNMIDPDPEGLRKTFALCEEIPSSDNRYSCYAGVGKDVPVMQQENDVRHMNELQSTDLSTMYEWCGYAPSTDGRRACNEGALSGVFWGGENDPSLSIQFCSLMQNGDNNACFSALIGGITEQVSDQSRQEQFCALMPDPYKDRCYNSV